MRSYQGDWCIHQASDSSCSLNPHSPNTPLLWPPDADAFLPKLLPRLEAAATETPDPECRSVCAAAATTVKRVAEEAAASRDADDRKVRSCVLACGRGVWCWGLGLQDKCGGLNDGALAYVACHALLVIVVAVPPGKASPDRLASER